MNGPFERYGEIHQIKQQLHVRELQMNGQLKRQRTNVYRMQQPDEESLEQLKMTLGACRAWIKEKTKPKKISKIDEKKGEADFIYKEQADGSVPENLDLNTPEEIQKSENRRERNLSAGATGNGYSVLGSQNTSGQNIGSGPQKDQSCRDGIFADPDELKRAILWAEVLGEPVSKRRRRRGQCR